MRIQPFFRWYDLWIGAYWDRHDRTLYVCLLPMLGVRIEFGRRVTGEITVSNARTLRDGDIIQVVNPATLGGETLEVRKVQR